jgi:hypothetical protein
MRVARVSSPLSDLQALNSDLPRSGSILTFHFLLSTLIRFSPKSSPAICAGITVYVARTLAAPFYFLQPAPTRRLVRAVDR